MIPNEAKKTVLRVQQNNTKLENVQLTTPENLSWTIHVYYHTEIQSPKWLLILSQSSLSLYLIKKWTRSHKICLINLRCKKQINDQRLLSSQMDFTILWCPAILHKCKKQMKGNRNQNGNIFCCAGSKKKSLDSYTQELKKVNNAWKNQGKH